MTTLTRPYARTRLPARSEPVVATPRGAPAPADCSASAVDAVVRELSPRTRGVFAAFAGRPVSELEDTLLLLRPAALTALEDHGVISLRRGAKTKLAGQVTLTEFGAAVAKNCASHPTGDATQLSAGDFRAFIRDAESNIPD
jgi:hypothetical protein